MLDMLLKITAHADIYTHISHYFHMCMLATISNLKEACRIFKENTKTVHFWTIGTSFQSLGPVKWSNHLCFLQFHVSIPLRYNSEQVKSKRKSNVSQVTNGKNTDRNPN